MKKNNFTQTTILPIARSLGYGYTIIDKDTIILENQEHKKIKLEINRKTDSVLVDGKEYKANQDIALFNIFPKEENIKKYGIEWNPLCNVYYLFDFIRKQENE